MLSERFLFDVVTLPYVLVGLVAIGLLLVPQTWVRIVGIAVVLALILLNYRASRSKSDYR